MSIGKLEAQAAHACELAALGEDKNSNLHRLYFRGGHHSKVILEGRDQQHMQDIVTYLQERDFACYAILDEGRTEVDHLARTAIATEVVDKNNAHVKATFSTFKLYRETPLAIFGGPGTVTIPNDEYGRLAAFWKRWHWHK